MNIYYSISNNLPKTTNEDHISFLRKYGTVLTETFLITNPSNIFEINTNNSNEPSKINTNEPSKISTKSFGVIDYETNIKLLRHADIIIMICDYVSIDTVFLLTEAIKKDKPILFLDQGCYDMTYIKEKIIGKYPKFAILKYSNTYKFETDIHQFFNDLLRGFSKYQKHFFGCIKKYLLLARKKKSIFLCGRTVNKIGTDLSNIHNMGYIDVGSFPQDNIIERIKKRSSESDCIVNGFIMRCSSEIENNTKALIGINLIPNLIIYLDTENNNAFNDYYQSWDNRTTIVRINANVSFEVGLARISQTISYFLDDQYSPNVTYYPIYPFTDNDIYTAYYFNIYSKDCAKLGLIAKDLFKFHSEFHGHIIVHPIQRTVLGSDFSNLDIYKSIFPSYHPIDEKDKQFYIGGNLSSDQNNTSSDMLEKLFLIVNKHSESTNPVMIEIYYYPNNSMKPVDENIIPLVYNKSLVPSMPLYRVNIEFTILRDLQPEFKLDLDILNSFCKKNGYCNGKWILASSYDEWIYQSHTIYSSYELAQTKLQNQLDELDEITNHMNLIINTADGYIEKIIGAWIFY